MTRNEIIEILKSLPDYPVVIEQDSQEENTNVSVTSIEVVDAYAYTADGVTVEYCKPNLFSSEDRFVKVIWIS